MITLASGGTAIIGQHIFDERGDTIQPGLNSSVGALFFQMRASWFSTLSYRQFPFDKQDLNITFELTSPNAEGSSAEAICLTPHATKQIPEEFRHPVWEVQSVEPTVDIASRYQTTQNPASPLTSVFDAAAKNVESQVFLNALHFNAEVSQVCRATFIVHVGRIREAYVYNYIFLEILLVLLGFSCAHAAPPLHHPSHRAHAADLAARAAQDLLLGARERGDAPLDRDDTRARHQRVPGRAHREHARDRLPLAARDLHPAQHRAALPAHS